MPQEAPWIGNTSYRTTQEVLAQEGSLWWSCSTRSRGIGTPPCFVPFCAEHNEQSASNLSLLRLCRRGSGWLVHHGIPKCEKKKDFIFLKLQCVPIMILNSWVENGFKWPQKSDGWCQRVFPRVDNSSRQIIFDVTFGLDKSNSISPLRKSSRTFFSNLNEFFFSSSVG